MVNIEEIIGGGCVFLGLAGITIGAPAYIIGNVYLDNLANEARELSDEVKYNAPYWEKTNLKKDQLRDLKDKGKSGIFIGTIFVLNGVGAMYFGGKEREKEENSITKSLD